MWWWDMTTERFIGNALTDRVMSGKLSMIQARILGRQFGKQLAEIRAIAETKECNN